MSGFLNDKVWVLHCTEPGCPWNEMVPREADRDHRQKVLETHRATDHGLLRDLLQAAIEEHNATVICLRGNRPMLDAQFRHDVELLLAVGLKEQIRPRRANGREQIELANGSRVLYMAGPERDLEERLRGYAAIYIDGTNYAPEASRHVLMAGGAK